MLKSTYKPTAALPPPLPPGWTEHKAPTGHTYYYNESTGDSTYNRPGPPTPASISPQPPRDPRASFSQYSAVPNLSDPATANAFLAQYDPTRQHQDNEHHGRGGRRGPHDGRDRPKFQPHDKPKSKVAIPGCEPWLLVYTKYGRRFVHNPVKNASYWRIPERVMQGVLELDIKGIKDRNAVPEDGQKSSESAEPQTTDAQEDLEKAEKRYQLASDEEEVEVTDDEDENAEGEGADEGGHRSKRQRTEDLIEDVPVEFDEGDIAFQLQAMGAEYGLDPGEYDDGNPDEWPEGAEGDPLSDEDARELFKDLLNDYGINPYSPWEKLIEEGRVVEDSRYTALNTMKARKDVWEEWSRAKIQTLKEQRAKQEKKDPRIPYMAFLQEKASPKLYWPEFRRKYKKEGPMRDTSLNDRDREKWYREYINRLKLPHDTLKKDLTALLRTIPLRVLNNKTLAETLPGQVLADVRYISLDPQIRDPLVAAYIQTLGPPPDDAEAELDDGAHKAREERNKRENALRERERAVAEEKRRLERQLKQSRAALREEERELERANLVGKKGLQSQLVATTQKDGEEQA